MNDEAELLNSVTEAQYKYFKCIESKWSADFVKETAGFFWDTTHWAYSLYAPKNCVVKDDAQSVEMQCTEKKNIAKKVKDIYKFLALHCHPDKCKQKDVTDILFCTAFTKVDEMYKNNDFEGLLAVKTHFENTGSVIGFDFALTLHDKQKFVQECMNKLWYLWKNPNCELRNVLVDEKVAILRLQEKNAVLRKQNVELKEKLDKLPADL